jgi:RNA polymerase sigma-70 factor, ECF subfamily
MLSTMPGALLAAPAIRPGAPAAAEAPERGEVAERTKPTTERVERLRRIFDEHFDFTWKLLRRLGLTPEDADDGAQEVFIVAARKLDQIAVGSERAYLVATSARVASTARRTRRRSREDATDESLLSSLVDAVPGPDELAEMNRARVLLDLVLDALSGELRVVFVLFELEGMTLHEIAAQLRLPLGTAKSRLRRAREGFDKRADQLMQRLARGGARP